MTRLGLISDIHANLPALQAVLKCFDQVGVDRILCAGDLVGGPHPDETVALLRQRHAVLIRGNTDSAMLNQARGRAPAERYHARQFALVRWTIDHISPSTLAFFESLPEEFVFTPETGTAIHIAHGIPGNPTIGLGPQEDLEIVLSAVSRSRAPFLLVGHSHCQWSLELAGVHLCNPGAVGGPLDGTNAAQYALAEWLSGSWHTTLHSAAYDLSSIRRSFQVSGLLEEGGPLARAFLASIETGRDVARDFLDLAFSLKTMDSHWIPDDVWTLAEATFDWPKESIPGN